MVDFYSYPDPRAYHGGTKELNRYIEALDRRRENYPHTGDKYTDVVKSLNDVGYAVLPNVISKKLIAEIKTELVYCLDNNIALDNAHKKNLKLKRESPYVRILEPVYNCESVARAAFDDTILGIASEYFNCVPLMSNVNLRKSFAGGKTATATQLYHVDGNSADFIKFFMYLDPVDKDGGPFTYVEGSHNEKFSGWKSKARWTDEEIESVYGKDSVKSLLGSPGDLIVANPTGFHKGMKPVRNDRYLLTVYYSVHSNTWKSTNLKIKKKDFKEISDVRAAEDLRVVRS